jgi:hypothetical protein
MTTITVLTLLVALHTTTIIHQQEAFARTIDNTFKRYENPTYGINIQYPSNWRIDEGDVYADDYVTDIVSFIAPIRSDTEAKITTDYSNTYEDFNVIESDPNSILSDKPAYKLVFTDEEEGIDYESMEIGTVIGDKVYFATYYTEEQYSDYLPTVQKMISSVERTRSGGGLETNSPTTRDGSDKINPPRNQLTDRYYEDYDWRGVCNNPFASNYISQPCDTLVTPDGNALTPNGKQVMEGLLCPQGRGIIGTLEMFVGSIPDHLESELATACGW